MPSNPKKSDWPEALHDAVTNIGKTLVSAKVEDKPASPPVDLSGPIMDDPVQQQIEYLRRKMKGYYEDETKHSKTQKEIEDQKKVQEEVLQLITKLGSKEFTSREHASNRLEEIGEAAKIQLKKAAEMQDGADLEVVTRARRLLVPLDAIDKERMGNLATTITSLGYRGAKAKNAVPDLIKLFADENRDLRKTIILTLGQIGPDAKDAVPVLIKILETPQQKTNVLDLKIPAIVALGQIGSKDAVPQLIDELKGNDPTYRQYTAMALGQIKEIQHSLPALTFALGDEKVFDVKKEIINSIGNFGAAAKSAVPALLEVKNAKAPIFDDDHPSAGMEFYQIKELAIEAIKKIEHPKPPGEMVSPSDQGHPKEESPFLLPPAQILPPLPPPPIPTSRRGK